MGKDALSLESLIPTLQLAIGPVILISGVGLLLLCMTNRIARVIDRARIVAADCEIVGHDERDVCYTKLEILSRRAKILRSSIAMAAVSVLLVAVLVILLFCGALFRVEIASVIVALFVGCMCSLIGSLVFFHPGREPVSESTLAGFPGRGAREGTQRPVWIGLFSQRRSPSEHPAIELNPAEPLLQRSAGLPQRRVACRVGSAWGDQDPHARHGFLPKLIMAGRLAGSVDGRPVVIDADESGFTVSFAMLRTAWKAWRTVAALLPVLAVAKRLGVPVRLNVAGLVSLEVLPVPSTLLRILTPRLASLA